MLIAFGFAAIFVPANVHVRWWCGPPGGGGGPSLGNRPPGGGGGPSSLGWGTTRGGEGTKDAELCSPGYFFFSLSAASLLMLRLIELDTGLHCVGTFARLIFCNF